MAWSFGNKFYTVPFVSAKGVNCKIDIYLRDYTEDSVVTLKGASDPVTFSDNDNDDILNDVVRHKSGYLRVVEEYSHGWLSNIYPQNAFDRYVEVFYGETLTFVGYIQVVNFSNELVPVPRVIELPIISPLGLAQKRSFSNTFYLRPQEVTLLELLDTVSTALGYKYVYAPKNYGYPDNVSLGLSISSFVISPFNENYHYTDESPMYKIKKGKEFNFLIDAICKAFGWMCHEEADALVFSAFDYDGDYLKYTVGHMSESAYTTTESMPQGAISLTDYMELADNNAEETTLLADTGIEIEYEGDSGERAFVFDHFYTPTDPVVMMPDFDPQFPNHAEIFGLCGLIPIPLLQETDIDGVFTFESNNKLSIGEHAVAWDEKEGFLVSIGSYPSNHDLFYVRFYLKRRSNQAYGISYDLLVRSDGILSGLHYRPDQDKDYYIRADVDASFDHPNYVQVNFVYQWGGDYPQLPSQALLFIHDIKLEVYEDSEPFSEYRYKPVEKKDIIPNSSNPPIVSSTITMPISLYRLTDNLIGDRVRSTKLTEYAYLLSPRQKLVSKFKIINSLTFPYPKMYRYLGKKWRIIAMSWNLWNDEVTITAHNSPTL